MSQEPDVYEVIIVGSGPAGYTAAIYSSRARLKTILVAGSLWGGQLMLTSEVENFPGFPEGIMGPDLMDAMWKQAERFGTEVLFEEADKVDLSVSPFIIETQSRKLKGRTVIIATGASPRWLGLESEERLRGRGISTCSTCDASLYTGKIAVVVGGGDTAMEEALSLTKFVKETKIIHRRGKLRASKILQERVKNNSKIEVILNNTVEEIFGDDFVEGLLMKNVKTGEEIRLKCDAVFIAIGQKPNTDPFKGQLDLEEGGYILVREDVMTSREGVFAAGVVKDIKYRQAITAAGDGCKAALQAERFLREE